MKPPRSARMVSMSRMMFICVAQAVVLSFACAPLEPVRPPPVEPPVSPPEDEPSDPPFRTNDGCDTCGDGQDEKAEDKEEAEERLVSAEPGGAPLSAALR